MTAPTTAVVPAVGVLPGTPAVQVNPIDEEITALERQRQEARQDKRKTDKTLLIGLGLALAASVAIGFANWGLESYRHAEAMACLNLKVKHPDNDCGTSSGYKPTMTTPTAQEATPAPSSMRTVTLVNAGDGWPIPTENQPVRVCGGAPDGNNLYPGKGTKFEGGKREDEGDGRWHIHLNRGECGISRLGDAS